MLRQGSELPISAPRIRPMNYASSTTVCLVDVGGDVQIEFWSRPVRNCYVSNNFASQSVLQHTGGDALLARRVWWIFYFFKNKTKSSIFCCCNCYLLCSNLSNIFLSIVVSEDSCIPLPKWGRRNLAELRIAELLICCSEESTLIERNGFFCKSVFPSISRIPLQHFSMPWASKAMSFEARVHFSNVWTKFAFVIVKRMEILGESLFFINWKVAPFFWIFFGIYWSSFQHYGEHRIVRIILRHETLRFHEHVRKRKIGANLALNL